MPASNFPGGFPYGLTVQNVPIAPTHANQVLWLCSNTGSDGNRGTKSKPFKTLDYALSKCENGAGDYIFTKPGHSETITGAGGITLDKGGVTIWGLGTYYYRPTFLMDGAATVSLLATAADVWTHNCVFKAGHADITVFATITAKGIRFTQCSIVENTTGENFLTPFSIGATDNDCDGFVLDDCEIIQGDAADVNAIIINKNQNDVKLLRNRIFGIYDTSPYSSVYCPNTEVLKNFLMAYNYIYDGQADGQNAPTVNLACPTSTGWVVHNRAQIFDTSGATPFLVATTGVTGLCTFDNYASGVCGASGYIFPAADSN